MSLARAVIGAGADRGADRRALKINTDMLERPYLNTSDTELEAPSQPSVSEES